MRQLFALGVPAAREKANGDLLPQKVTMVIDPVSVISRTTAAPHAPKLWIVSGPTCVGKSAFIQSNKFQEISKSATEQTDLCFESDTGRSDIAFHYNILKPYRELVLSTESRERNKAVKVHGDDFLCEQRWKYVVDFSQYHERQAIVLACSKKAILKRRALQIDDSQKNRHWWVSVIDFIDSLDLKALYRAWLERLRKDGIEYSLIDSRDFDYRPLKDEAELFDVIDSEPVTFSANDIEEIMAGPLLAHHASPHQFIDGGIEDLLPGKLDGKSIIDIGVSAHGLCFAAETRNARDLVSFNLDADGFSRSLMLRMMHRSDVKVIGGSVSSLPHRRFDHVFAIDPVIQLQNHDAWHKLAQMTKESLSICVPPEHAIKQQAQLISPLCSPSRRLNGLKSLMRSLSPKFLPDSRNENFVPTASNNQSFDFCEMEGFFLGRGYFSRFELLPVKIGECAVARFYK
ncbi:MAG TPA: hypothetical protein V6D17_11470 [Candidatus Obscuribacterales bacterium]